MFSSDKWLSATDTGFYPETIDQSLRFEDGDNPYLNRTPSSVGNRRTFTISAWLKRGDLGATAYIMKANTGTGDALVFRNSSTGTSPSALYLFFADTAQGALFSSQKFRDTTNWYHIVAAIDTTQSTASNRVKLYVNGEQITAFDTASYPSLNYDSTFNTAVSHQVGAYANGNSHYDGYMAEFNFIDGTALTPTSFGETKNGVWIPKAISGLTYGTNGFRLTFADSSNLGDDTSGNGNDLTSNGLASTDVVLDSPTNFFPTLNFLDKKSGITLSEGNLKRVDSADAWESITAPFGMTSGKYYAEFIVTVNGSGSFNNFMVGVVKSGFNGNISDSRFWASFDGHSYHAQDGKKVINGSGTSATYGATWTVDDIIGVALDLDAGTLTFYKNNVSQGVANTGLSGEYVFACATYHSGTHMIVNFGQDSSFAGNETAQNNSDANGIGDFYYTPPSGFLALCSSNLPDTTLSPNQDEQADDYFIAKTYSGDSNNSTQISTGFQPDWVWIKNITAGGVDGSGEHMLYDSSRGVHDDLNSNNTSAEATNTNGLQEFGSTFFRPGSLTRTNETGDNYNSWSWRVNGGTTSSNTSGTITSTTQVSLESGFSIVLYSGNGTSNADITIGHGLTNLTPRMVIVKNRSDASRRWQVYHEDLSADSSVVTKNILLSGNSAESGYTSQIRAVSSTTFTVRDVDANDNAHVNKSGSNYVAYVFAQIDGFSRFGTYEGNNSSSDNTFVYTGFLPHFIMIKNIDAAEDWTLRDLNHSGYYTDGRGNPVNIGLQANTNANPTGGSAFSIDFVSNGFKIRGNNADVGASNTYIYAAWAKQPFKFSNGR